MPTAQARLTRTRGLHATRSSIRSDNDMSSLPERRVACIFFFSPVASCAHVPPPKFQDSDLRRPIAAWFPGVSDLRALSWAHVRVRGAAGRGCHIPAWLGIARFARSSYVNRGFIRDIDVCGDVWQLSAAFQTRICAHGRDYKACTASKAAIGRWRSISRIKPRFT
jgi:hypothetical protein